MIIRKVELIKNVRIGPVIIESSYKTIMPDSPCHDDVGQVWQKWIKKKKINGDISEIFNAVAKFQKTVLEKGCDNYEYSLDLKNFGRFSTVVIVKKENETSENDKDKIVKDIHTTLEIGDQVIHKSWKAYKMKNNNDWEIILII